MSKKDIFAILGVKTKEEVQKIFEYKLSPEKALNDCEVNMIINVCENYQINPNLGMLYLRRDEYQAIYPTLKVDGWYKLVNDQEDCMGFEFIESDNKIQMGINSVNEPIYIFEYIGCKIYRKGREITPLVKEYIVECFNKNNSAYFTHGNRLLRHASFVQAARVVYNLSGIYEPSEEINFVKEKHLQTISSGEFDVIGDEVIITESDAVTEDEVIITESESDAVTEDEVIITESDAVTEDEVIITESDAVTEDKKVLVDLTIGLPDYELTQIKGYLKRGKAMDKLATCVDFLKKQYDESFYLFIDDQASKVS